MNIASLVIAIIGVVITIILVVLVDTRTRKTLRRLDAKLIADKSLDEVRQIERLIEDIDRSGEKRGRVVQRKDGTWGIDWTM